MRTGGIHLEFGCDPWGAGPGGVARRVQNPFCTNIVMLHIASKVKKSRIQWCMSGGMSGGHWRSKSRILGLIFLFSPNSS